MVCIIPIVFLHWYYEIHLPNRFHIEPVCTTQTISIKFSRDTDGYDYIEFNYYAVDRIYQGTYWLYDRDRSKIKDIMTVKYLFNEPEKYQLVIDK